MESIIIIIAVILIITAFFVGRNLASKPIENNNYKIKKELEELQLQKNTELKELEILVQTKKEEEAKRRHELDKLDSDLSWKWKDIYNAEDKLKRIENQYQDKLQVIKNTEQLAKDAYDKNMQIYAQKTLDEQTKYEKTIQKHQKEINSIKEELNSLKATKAASIAAARKEQEIHDNMDEYCLILPKEEERDIALLREIQYKVSKPRAIAMCIWTGWYQKLAQTKFPKILGKQDVCGVYKITNQKTGECYIGQAVDVRTRWFSHAKAAIGIDTPQGNKLYAAMQEYGLDDFSFELLEECKAEDLNVKEKYFIELYNAKTFGYNSQKGNK